MGTINLKGTVSRYGQACIADLVIGSNGVQVSWTYQDKDGKTKKAGLTFEGVVNIPGADDALTPYQAPGKTASGTVKMTSPMGKTREVPASDAQAFLALGYKLAE